jgi:DNA-binding NtrC family response regulator
MPEMSGDQVLQLLKQQDPFIEVIMLTGHGSIDSAIECTKLGAFSYLQKPCETDELLKTLRAAYHKRLTNRLASEAKEMEELARIACEESPLAALHRLRELERKPR